MGHRQVEREPRLGERGEIGTAAWKGKGGLHTSEERKISRRRGRACKENLPRRKHERVSGGKNFRKICRVLVSLQVFPALKWEKRLGDKGPAHKMTGRNESGWLVGEIETPQREEEE